MNSYLQNSAPRSNALSYVTILVIALLILDSVLGGMLHRAARDALVTPTYWGEQIVLGIRAIPFVAGAIVYRNDMQALQQEVASLRERNSLFDALKDENAALRRIAGIIRDEERKVASVVISPASSRQFGTLLIDAGTAQGVEQGDIVLSEYGYAIGEIESASKNSARVLLYFAPQATIEVTAKSSQFTLDGRGGGNARAQVPRELPLSVRDVLYAPRAGARPVGIIGHLSSASSSAYTDVYALLPVPIESLRLVVVLLK